MKKRKILSLVLACAMLVGMVPAALAENPAVPTATEPSFAISTGTNIMGKNATDLMERANITPDGDAANTYKITGTAKYVKDWTAFNNTVAEEQNGHYLSLKVTAPDSFTSGTVTVTGSKTKTWTATEFFTEENGASETLTIRLDAITAKKFTIAFDPDGNGNTAATTYTIDFSAMTLAGQEPSFAISTSTNILGKNATDLTTGAAIASDSAANTYKVTGTAKYVEGWTAFNTTVEAEQSGHYLALSVTRPEAFPDAGTVTVTGSKTKTWAANEFFTESSNTSETLTLRLDAVTAKKFTIAFDPDGDGSQTAKTYTIDFSTMTLAEKEPPVEVGEPGFAISTSNSILGKKASDLMTGAAIASGDTANAYKVTGTAKYVEGWTAFNGADATEQSGHYLALSVTRPENFPTAGTVTVTGSKTKTWAADDFFTESNKTSETLTLRLDAVTAKKFTIAFDPDGSGSQTAKTYTIDFSTMTLAEKEPPVVVGEPGFAISTSTSILGKKASDLMLNATIAPSTSGANTYKVTGTAKYVENWTDFNGTEATEQNGHYLALSVTRPENFPDAGTVTVKGSKEKTWTATEFFTEENKTSETLVMRLDAITSKTFTIAFDPDGSGSQAAKTYTIEFSDMSLVVKEAVVPVQPTTSGNTASSSVAKNDLDSAIAAATTTPPSGSPTSAPVVVIDATKGTGNAEISPSAAPAAAVSIPKDAVGALKTATSNKADLTLSIATHVGTVEVDKDVIDTLNEAVKDGSAPVVLNVEAKAAPGGSAATHVYEINFTAGGQEIPIQNATLTITLRFSGVSDPAAVKIANNKTNTLITPTSYALVSGNTYDFTFTTSHLTQFSLTTAAATTGTVTKAETSNDGILGTTVKFSVSGAGSITGTAYLTVSVRRGTGANAVTFCTVLPITLTSGVNNNAATIYVQGGATVEGAWVTSAAPTLASGGTVTGGILASLS